MYLGAPPDLRQYLLDAPPAETPQQARTSYGPHIQYESYSQLWYGNRWIADELCPSTLPIPPEVTQWVRRHHPGLGVRTLHANQYRRRHKKGADRALHWHFDAETLRTDLVFFWSEPVAHKLQFENCDEPVYVVPQIAIGISSKFMFKNEHVGQHAAMYDGTPYTTWVMRCDYV